MITETISGFRLSPHQKRLWLLQKESGAAYVAQSVICIEGNFKPEVLKAALQNIVNRHQILRTRFHCLPGMKIPVMVVKDSSVLSWREIYLSKDNSQKFTITSIFQEEKSYPFDFEKGPLLRCSLLQLSANKHILVVTLPALCADARTLKNLFAEISDSYSACLQGKNFSKEVVQYVQFSEWQNDLLEDSEAEAGKNYWSQQDFSALDTLTLPFADKFYQKTEFQPQVYNFTLSPHLTQEIKTNHRGAETRGGEGLNSNLVSLFLLSCWQILLWRFTGQAEIIVGKICHGREYEELNDVLGLFAKSLPIRSRLNTNLHFSEVLEQVTQAVEEAKEWQEDFISEKNVESFPFIFEFEQLPEKCLASDAFFSFDTQYICLEPFQIKLSCIDKKEFLELGFYYNANLFSADAIHRLAEQFQTLLVSAIENPDAAISQLQILPANQLEQLLLDFNQTQVDSPQNKCIHQLFEEQATLTPNKIAVVFEDKQLTYSELNQSANQLAHYLQKLGVQPDVVVGICLERSYLMIVAMLGVLKAGGAYLPLEPALPKEAIAFRLQDAQVPILLTQQGIDLIQNSRVVCLDTDWKDVARESTENTTSKATPENLVYVIYTSGSTGKPKGVAIEHQQLCNYLYGILEKLELPKDASFATVSTFAADLGNTVIFPCLCTGGCLHVVSWERASDAAALAAYFRRHPIDCLKIVPSHISALLTSSDIESILPRQLLILGGEATDWHLVETIQQYAPHCRIINHYGPTETTVGVLTYTVSPQPALIRRDLKAATVPIGRPIANTQVYVLDKQLQPVPIGVPGELYIGGKSLARSYLNRPELTADRFIANPFVDFKLDRLYKTGDLVRYLPDGNLEFLHRLDDQVKIRGFRIELGEISAVLSQHPAVQEVVVVAREDGLGDKRLVAYIVPSVPNTQHLTLTGDLRSLLKEKLPEYMIPSAFVVLKALPLTSNGKIDRHALPAPDEAALIEKTFVAPRTPVEEVIAAMWAQLLGVQRLSIDDNFFDLGGHSLLATQVISRLRTAFGVEIPLRQLFASPTVAGLAAHIETAMRAGQELETTAIPRAAKDKDLPLSFAQWRLWFLNQLEPESPSYNLPRVIRLTGPLNIAALEQSFNEVIKRHEVLRTTFARVNGQPMQVIHPKMDLRLSILDCTTIPQSQIQNFVLEEVQQGFDLAKGPLLRAKLLQVGEQEHLLLLTMHHIVSDAWSTGVLIEQMAALYAAYCEGKPSPLPELPIQYADFAVWQREWLQGEQLRALLDYWKQQLQGDLPVLELPADRPRPSVQTFAGKHYSLVLPKELSVALKTLSQQEGVTLFMTLLAAFKTLLYRYTGQQDILIGSPIANRNRAEIESLIGFFVNTLVLRTDLFGNPSFQELLGRVREVTLGAYAHQDLPFEKLVEELQPERNLSHAPLFQAMFVFQNAPMKTLELPGLSIQPLKVNSGTAKFDLTLSMQDTEQGLIATFEYNTDLFDEATISRYLGHFQTLLAGIVANPQQRLSELPLLTTTEQQQLVEWNNTKTEYGNELCLHQLFEAQVERTPDAVAVVYENEQLTYQELNQRANQLAHYLQKLGVGPEVLVGICLERSLEMVIAILGILKAGGAYVPLDPAYPQERLAFMLQDAQVPVLLMQQRLIEMLPRHQTRIVCLDTDWESIAQESQQNPVSGSTADNLAYVIYTSGSTGQPKGVLVKHKNVIRLFDAVQSWYHFNNKDVWTLFHSIAFDFSVWELWGALFYGGRLVVVPYWLSRSPEDFYKLLLTQQVTVLNQTPSAFRQLIRAEESLGTAKNLALRLVIFGGEALEIQSLKPWFERHGDQFPQLVNMYGITETTVHVTYRPITMADLKVSLGSVIGRPIPDLQIYLLDQNQQLVPIGVPGEMHIGGAGLARGYLNRPDLTDLKFIPNPFSNKPGARLYRSGDLARYLPNGEIEYLGRIDHQVKIRGFRIELGEIENALAKHQAVRETLVLAREAQPGNKQLVAYVIPNYERALTTSDLRNFLLNLLPEYMVPSAFVLLEALPLTPNGKVDRRALPAPDTARPELEGIFVAPRTPEEKILAEIWAEVLGLEQVGIHDNFFALGGDSIRSIQVQSQAKEKGLSFSIQQLFKHQTIHELVQNLTTTELGTEITERVQPFEFICEEDQLNLPDDVEHAYPLTKLQMGMLFHSEYNLETATYHNVSSYHLQAPFNLQHFQTTLQQMAVRHPVLRTSFDLNNFNEPLQLVHKVVDVPLQVEDLCHLDLAEQEEVITTWFEAEKFRKFDWTKAPLWRVHIHLRSEKAFQFSLTEHHAILDGWSVASMLTEMFKCYFSLLGEKVHLIEPPPVARFRDFVALEREAIASETYQRYWTEKLSDSALTMLPRWLATNQEEPVQQVGVYEVPISLEVSDGLNQLARSLGVPLKSVLLAAHMRVLSLLSGQSDLVTGLVSNGRPEETDGERVLGLFLNTVPFRLQCKGGSWVDLVRKTFEAEQELMPFRRYPLAELQTVLGRQSLFEIAFNFVNFHVYKNVSNAFGVKVIDAKSFAVTNFTFLANFHQVPFSSDVFLNLGYDTTALCPQQIRAIGDYYARTLTAMASEPEVRYESYNLLSPQERNQLLVEWNNTQADYPQDQCIHQLFEDQVERSPDAIAVIFEDQQLTYRELNTKANQLAHHLQTLGVGPEVLVGICVERSLEMVIALLGILKAGGAYVPLDPAYPQERLAFMLENSQVSVLLTQEKLVAPLLEHRARVVCLDADWQEIAKHSADNPINKATALNLVYAIYTSGSTGRPKGVQITHGALVNFLSAMRRTPGLSEKDILLSVTTLSFDIAALELYLPLIVGARLVVVSREVAADGTQLLEKLASSGATVMQATPATWRLLLAAGWQGSWQLKILCGGEALDRELANLLLERGTEVWNLYGPTETTIWSSVQKVESKDSIVSIGRPIANTQIYLLDSQRQPVPIGVPGELHIGGKGLARGYLNRPELTAEKFIPNPFSNEPGARLYKTGDLARYLSDGNIEFLGRIDNQVKIRGFRIELGEIEAALTQHSAVRASVVVVREDEPGSKRLVAYLIPDPEQALTITELRRFLKDKLPEYMMPSAFMILEALPLTPNGKVNRQALPQPSNLRPELAVSYVKPQTEIEKAITTIWQQALNLTEIGLHDNFFEIGGHSLLAIQLIAHLRQKLQIEIPLQQIFASSTIAEQAAEIERLKSQTSNLEIDTIPKIDRDSIPDISRAIDKFTDAQIDLLLKQLVTLNYL